MLSKWHISPTGDVFKYVKSKQRKRKGISVLFLDKNLIFRWRYFYRSY